MEIEGTTRVKVVQPLLCARRLNKRYAQRPWLSRHGFLVTALEDVSLTIRPGSTLALLGESGSGKSTLARCLARLEEPDSGEIWFDGINLSTLTSRELFAVRQRIQLIFQDPATALNPRFSAAEIIGEPLGIQRGATRKEQRRRALALMEHVGLSPHWADRSPQEFSGGQRQRLAIARALALEPALLILDEALSGLDLSIQSQIVNLLLDLQVGRSLSYLFISHDLRLAAHLADEIAVMQQGRIVEQGAPLALFSAPQHSHTRALLASVPEIEWGASAPGGAC